MGLTAAQDGDLDLVKDFLQYIEKLCPEIKEISVLLATLKKRRDKGWIYFNTKQVHSEVPDAPAYTDRHWWTEAKENDAWTYFIEELAPRLFDLSKLADIPDFVNLLATVTHEMGHPLLADPQNFTRNAKFLKLITDCIKAHDAEVQSKFGMDKDCFRMLMTNLESQQESEKEMGGAAATTGPTTSTVTTTTTSSTGTVTTTTTTTATGHK